MQRRTLLKRTAPLLALASTLPLSALAAAPMVEIWKDPSCGCCQDWVKHLNKNGFATRVSGWAFPPSWAPATPGGSAATPSKATCPRATCTAC